MSVTKIVLIGAAGFAAVAALEMPAAAQYPQPGYGNPVGQVINNILGYGRYPYGNYGYNQYGNQSSAVDQCARAVEARLNGGRGYYGYGNQGYRGGRVQGVTRVERKKYGLKVWGVASSGNRGYSGYNRNGYGNYGYSSGADLKWDCEVNNNGRIRDIDVSRRTATWRGY
jgi:hypothetical protein